jgi:hypothetical protein
LELATQHGCCANIAAVAAIHSVVAANPRAARKPAPRVASIAHHGAQKCQNSLARLFRRSRNRCPGRHLQPFVYVQFPHAVTQLLFFLQTPNCTAAAPEKLWRDAHTVYAWSYRPDRMQTNSSIGFPG